QVVSLWPSFTLWRLRACVALRTRRADDRNASLGPQVLRPKMLDTDHFVACTADRPNDFVEFQVQCTSVPILSVLDQKNDEKRDDRGRGIYDQLPVSE